MKKFLTQLCCSDNVSNKTESLNNITKRSTPNKPNDQLVKRSLENQVGPYEGIFVTSKEFRGGRKQHTMAYSRREKQRTLNLNVSIDGSDHEDTISFSQKEDKVVSWFMVDTSIQTDLQAQLAPLPSTSNPVQFVHDGVEKVVKITKDQQCETSSPLLQDQQQQACLRQSLKASFCSLEQLAIEPPPPKMQIVSHDFNDGTEVILTKESSTQFISATNVKDTQTDGMQGSTVGSSTQACVEYASVGTDSCDIRDEDLEVPYVLDTNCQEESDLSSETPLLEGGNQDKHDSRTRQQARYNENKVHVSITNNQVGRNNPYDGLVEFQATPNQKGLYVLPFIPSTKPYSIYVTKKVARAFNKAANKILEDMEVRQIRKENALLKKQMQEIKESSKGSFDTSSRTSSAVLSLQQSVFQESLQSVPQHQSIKIREQLVEEHVKQVNDKAQTQMTKEPVRKQYFERANTLPIQKEVDQKKTYSVVKKNTVPTIDEIEMEEYGYGGNTPFKSSGVHLQKKKVERDDFEYVEKPKPNSQIIPKKNNTYKVDSRTGERMEVKSLYDEESSYDIPVFKPKKTDPSSKKVEKVNLDDSFVYQKQVPISKETDDPPMFVKKSVQVIDQSGNKQVLRQQTLQATNPGYFDSNYDDETDEQPVIPTFSRSTFKTGGNYKKLLVPENQYDQIAENSFGYGAQMQHDDPVKYNPAKFSAEASFNVSNLLDQLKSSHPRSTGAMSVRLREDNGDANHDIYNMLIDNIQINMAPPPDIVHKDFIQSQEHADILKKVQTFDADQHHTYFFPTISLDSQQVMQPYRGIITKLDSMYTDLEKEGSGWQIHEFKNSSMNSILKIVIKSDSSQRATFDIFANILIGRLKARDATSVYIIYLPEHPDTLIEGDSFLAALHSLAVGKQNDVVYTGSTTLETADFVSTSKITPDVIVKKYQAYNKRMVVVSSNSMSEVQTTQDELTKIGVRMIKGIAFLLHEQQFTFSSEQKTSAYNVILTQSLGFAWMLMSQQQQAIHMINKTFNESDNLIRFFKNNTLIFEGDIGASETLMDLFKAGYLKVPEIKQRLTSYFKTSQGLKLQAAAAKSRLLAALSNTKTKDSEIIYAITGIFDFVPVSSNSVISPQIRVPLSALITLDKYISNTYYKQLSGSLLSFFAQLSQDIALKSKELDERLRQLADTEAKSMTEEDRAYVDSRQPQVYTSEGMNYVLTTKRLAQILQDAQVDMGVLASSDDITTLEFTSVQASCLQMLQQVIEKNNKLFLSIMNKHLQSKAITKQTVLKDINEIQQQSTKVLQENFSGLNYEDVQDAGKVPKAEKNRKLAEEAGRMNSHTYINGSYVGVINSKLSATMGMGKPGLVSLDIFQKIGPNLVKQFDYALNAFQKYCVSSKDGRRYLKLDQMVSQSQGQSLYLFNYLRGEFNKRVGPLSMLRELNPYLIIEYGLALHENKDCLDKKLKPKHTAAYLEQLKKQSEVVRNNSDLTQQTYDNILAMPTANRLACRTSQSAHMFLSQDGSFFEQPLFITYDEEPTYSPIYHLEHIKNNFVDKGVNYDFLNVPQKDNKYQGKIDTS